MKTLWVRYLNEVVGLTIMALMVIALVAGQAQSAAPGASSESGRDIAEIRLTIGD